MNEKQRRLKRRQMPSVQVPFFLYQIQIRVCRGGCRGGCQGGTGLRMHLSARSGVRHHHNLCPKQSFPTICRIIREYWNISVPQPGRKLEPSGYTSWRSEFFEQSVVLIEAYWEERIKCTALTAGHFRTTCLSLPCLQHGRRVWSDPF